MKNLSIPPIKATKSIYLNFRASLLLCLGMVSSGIAQAPQKDSLNYPPCAFLSDLHQGTLLIRLPDRSLSLKALRERGLKEEATQLRRRLKKEHQETMLSFQHTFSFAPVYFFYASHSEAIREGRYAVVFDRLGQAVPPDQIQEPIFVGEFGETPQLGISGLILMNNHLLPLAEPLPFYEKKFLWGGLIRRSKAEMAEAFQKRLSSAYESCP